MTHEALKVGDKVFYVETLPGEPTRRVRASVWHMRWKMLGPCDTWELKSIDLRVPGGILKECSLRYIVLLSAVEQLAELVNDGTSAGPVEC